MHWGKTIELWSDPDQHTLVKYLRENIPCSCLDEKYKQVKSITKMGNCFNKDCPKGGKVKRSTMLFCTRCRLVNYCSSACQKANWQVHKVDCDAHIAAKAKLNSKEVKKRCSHGYHGFDIDDADADIYLDFQRDFTTEFCSCFQGGERNISNLYAAAYMATRDKYPQVLIDVDKTECVRKLCLADCVEGALYQDINKVGEDAAHACLFEQHIAVVLKNTQDQIDYQAISDLMHAKGKGSMCIRPLLM